LRLPAAGPRPFCDYLSGATGLNLFTNAGVDAGQTVPHFHVHVVPRYPGTDPRRLFQQKNHEPQPIEVRREVGARVRQALAELEPAGQSR
jgi:histidine triad (HIT) family protein